MFTGIIQGIAKLIYINEKENFRIHVIKLPNYMLEKLEAGASIAHNGCCLTVTKIDGDCVSFDLIKETLKITNLSELLVGDVVNVERAIKFNDEIGGHLMSGHITTTARIIKKLILKNNQQIWFEIQNPTLMKYILHKGFIGIDGISLTVSKITNKYFCVHLIPETLQRTTIGTKKLKQKVNIEIDLQTRAIIDTVERILINKNISVS